MNLAEDTLEKQAIPEDNSGEETAEEEGEEEEKKMCVCVCVCEREREREEVTLINTMINGG